MPSRFVCSKCGRDCRTSIAYESHSKKCTGTFTVATAKPATKPIAIEQSVVATPTETVITVNPTVEIAEIADPFLSNRVSPPYTGTGVGESTAKLASGAATAVEQAATVPQQLATAETTSKPIEQSATVASEQPAVEPQKKTATATAETSTAQATQTVAGKPIVQPIHIHIPKEALPSAEGRRDQSQPEVKPSIMMPLGSVTKEIEVTTKGMEIQVGSTLLMYYDWLRGRGYERSLSEFINQTVEAYFTEKGLVLGITFRRD